MLVYFIPHNTVICIKKDVCNVNVCTALSTKCTVTFTAITHCSLHCRHITVTSFVVYKLVFVYIHSIHSKHKQTKNIDTDNLLPKCNAKKWKLFSSKGDLEAPSSASRFTENNNHQRTDLLHKCTKCGPNMVNLTKTLNSNITTQILPYEHMKVLNVLQLLR